MNNFRIEHVGDDPSWFDVVRDLPEPNKGVKQLMARCAIEENAKICVEAFREVYGW